MPAKLSDIWQGVPLPVFYFCFGMGNFEPLGPAYKQVVGLVDAWGRRVLRRKESGKLTVGLALLLRCFFNLVMFKFSAMCD